MGRDLTELFDLLMSRHKLTFITLSQYWDISIRVYLHQAVTHFVTVSSNMTWFDPSLTLNVFLVTAHSNKMASPTTVLGKTVYQHDTDVLIFLFTYWYACLQIANCEQFRTKCSVKWQQQDIPDIFFDKKVFYTGQERNLKWYRPIQKK